MDIVGVSFLMGRNDLVPVGRDHLVSGFLRSYDADQNCLASSAVQNIVVKLGLRKRAVLVPVWNFLHANLMCQNFSPSRLVGCDE